MSNPRENVAKYFSPGDERLLLSDYSISPVGYIRTPYKEKFGIPRQPGLVKSAIGIINLCGKSNDINTLRGIEQFSHLWLVFEFHQTRSKGWSPLVRPPRLGGNEKLGVFATRSTFRPNGIGMSVVSFEGVEHRGGQVSLLVSGMDLLDGTPIIDIKPYVPYADAVKAQGGFAHQAPANTMQTEWTEEARRQCDAFPKEWALLTLIPEILSQDPRPAFHNEQSADRIYGVRLFDVNVQWKVNGNTNQVIAVTSADL